MGASKVGVGASVDAASTASIPPPPHRGTTAFVTACATPVGMSRCKLQNWRVALISRGRSRMVDRTSARVVGSSRCPSAAAMTSVLPVSGRTTARTGRDSDVVRGGPNYSLSLAAARDNFVRIGAVEDSISLVRPPSSPGRDSR